MKKITPLLGAAALAVTIVAGCTGNAEPEETTDTTDAAETTVPTTNGNVITNIDGNPIELDPSSDGTTETGIIDSIEDNVESFDVAEELEKVYDVNDENSAVVGDEEKKDGGLDASGLVAPGIDESQLEAGVEFDFGNDDGNQTEESADTTSSDGVADVGVTVVNPELSQ